MANEDIPDIDFNRRYSQNTHYIDWYFDAAALVDVISEKLRNNREAEILIPGCGVSSLGEELYRVGYRNVTNMDSSEAAIESLNKRTSRILGDSLQNVVGNALDMSIFPAGSFDCVVDKALLDNLLAYRGVSGAAKYLAEITRVLSPGGLLLLVSHSPPETCVDLLQRYTTPRVSAVRFMSKDVSVVRSPGASETFWIYFVRK